MIKYPEIVKVEVTLISENHEVFGYSYISILEVNKIEEGQDVNIKLDTHPFSEYGILKGTVRSISNTSKAQYIVKYDLPDGLKTSYGEEINYLPKMKGQAQVFTGEVPIFDRIFKNSFKKIR